MQSLLSLKGLVSSLLLAGLATAAPTVDLKPRQSTCNTPTDRACWSDGFDITTDYEAATPEGAPASAPVTYTLDVTEAYNWTGPDGIVKEYVQLINNQFPGPTIFANWGDNITVTVTNNLPLNG
jgi:FtsP/CotA-like multicopper oxidase with cupredoxin domain